MKGLSQNIDTVIVQGLLKVMVLVFLKWELPALLPLSFKKEEHWREDGCK